MIQNYQNPNFLKWDSALFNANMGMPRQSEHTGVLKDQIEFCLDWIRRHGKFWIRIREVDPASREKLYRECDSRAKSGLQRFLRNARNGTLHWMVGGPHPELTDEIQRRWNEEKPDEFYLLDTMATTFVQLLLRDQAGKQREYGAIYFYSPSVVCGENSDPHFLLNALSLPGDRGELPFSVMESGMLKPKHSRMVLFSKQQS